jgi:LPS-assembly protein
VKSLIFFTKNLNGFSFNTSAGRYQNFQSATRGDLITILRMPSFEVSSVDRQLFKTPIFWSYSGALEGVSRREPTFKTNDLVGRLDVNPRASLPLFLRGWTLRPEIGLRNTYYTQRKSPVGASVGTPLNSALNRKALEFVTELRPPTVGKIFAKPIFGRTLKHTIEPRLTYRLVSGVTGFTNVIRFDQRDILSDTNEIEYGLVQRLFLKPNASACQDKLPGEACESGPREFITWEIAQRQYLDENFGGAIVNGKRNVLTTTADFTGIAFLTEPRRFSPIISKLRVRATSNVDGSWQLDYDSKKGRINASTTFVNYRLGDFFLGGSHAFLHAPGEIFVSNPIPGPEIFNQFRVLVGYGGPNRRGLSSAASVGFDANRDFLQYGSFQSSYNWDCCGLSMEYRRFALGTVRNENQFRFAFTLANIGTFGNMKRQERLF